MTVTDYDGPDQIWETAAPESVNLNSDKLTEAYRFIETHAKRINSLLIIKNGKLITERYFNGYQREHYAHICSVTKSILSALIGIAMDRGYIESVDQPILDIFIEADPRKTHYLMQEITIKHLLRMSSGIISRYNRNGHEPLWERMESSQDWAAFILELPVVKERMNQFNYTSMNSHLLSAIITKTTGMSAAAFANKYLFKQLGIAPVYSEEKRLEENRAVWLSDPQGINNGGFGLCMRPLDLARFGFLYLNKGLWEGEQVISDHWIFESMNDQAHHPDYGYHWWLEKGHSHRYSAQGFGGQAVYVDSEHDLVVVITSNSGTKATSGRGPADIWKKYILPSIK